MKNKRKRAIRFFFLPSFLHKNLHFFVNYGIIIHVFERGGTMKTKLEYVSKIIVVVYFLIATFVIASLDESIQKQYHEMINRGSSKNISSVIVSSKPRIVKAKKIVKKAPTAITQVDTTGQEVLATFSGTVSHYGPNCSGCSGVTASGYSVKNTIYYQDKTYGTLRIVAADPSIPLGSVLRLQTSNSTILAIVLDRGGAIGFSRKFILDLLCESEAQSYQYGILKNTTVDVLRYGY